MYTENDALVFTLLGDFEVINTKKKWKSTYIIIESFIKKATLVQANLG